MPFVVASNDTSRQLQFNNNDGGLTERRKLFSIRLEGHDADTKCSLPVMTPLDRCVSVEVVDRSQEGSRGDAMIDISETIPLKRPPDTLRAKDGMVFDSSSRSSR